MGIHGLLSFLQDASRKCHINEFRGCTVAIDSYCWLHKGAFSCADKLVRGENTDMYIQYCLKLIDLLEYYNIKPVMVFDGQYLPAKKDTELKRQALRQKARARGNELSQLGKTNEALQYFRQCVNITHEMALKLIKACRKRNIDCIVAPYEADAQLAYLNLQGIVDVIITEDSDLVMFGCDKVLFKFVLDGSCVLVEREKLCIAMKMRTGEYTPDKFRYMCILSGCDYLDSLPGIGLKRAHKAISMTVDPDIYKLLKRLPSYLNMRNLTMSEEYMERFKLADATIKHQVVYDSIKRSLVRLTDPEVSGISEEYLRNAGQMYDDNLAFQMALGNIDPFSKKVMDNWNPDVALSSTSNTKSIWSKSYHKSGSNHVLDALNTKVKCIKKKSTPISSENPFTVQEKQMAEYDDKLLEELKMYTTVEPTTKRQKFNEKIGSTMNFELVVNKLDKKAAANNPFSKEKRLIKLSKFKVITVESSECIKSKFFTPKSNDINTESENITVDPNVDESHESNEKDTSLVNDYSETKECNMTEDNLATSECTAEKHSLQTKFSKRITNSIGRVNSVNVDVYNCESLCSCDNNRTSNSEEISLQIDSNEIKGNNMDTKTSPILSLYSQSHTSHYQTRQSSLELFKFNKCKKKIRKHEAQRCGAETESGKTSLESVITKIDISLNDSICESDNNRIIEIESDIENLTPVDKCTDMINSNNKFEKITAISNSERVMHVRSDNVFTAIDNCRVEAATAIDKEVNTSDNKFSLLENRPFSQEVRSAPHATEKLKRFNSCRSIGLSRSRKKITNQNQPTLLSMFNKMSSKD